MRLQNRQISWTKAKSDAFRAVMDSFQQFENTAGFFIGNEVLNTSKFAQFPAEQSVLMIHSCRRPSCTVPASCCSRSQGLPEVKGPPADPNRILSYRHCRTTTHAPELSGL